MRSESTKNQVAFILCLISYLFAGMASTLMSVYLPIAIPEIKGVELTEAQLGEYGAYINAISLYGWMVGGFLFGFLSDKYGRRQSLILSTVLYALTTIMIYAAKQWQLVLLLRFLTGMGIGGVLLVSTVYISEIWPAKTRPVMLGILAVAFPAGIVTTGVITVMFAHWRSAFLMGLFPLAASIVMWFLINESEEWKSGKPSADRPHSIFSKMYAGDLLNGSLVFGAVLIGLWSIFSWMPTWVQSILPVEENGQEQRGIIMMLLGIGGITGGLISGFLITKIGTRKTLLLTFASLTIMCLVLFLSNKVFSPIVYVETALLALFFGISQGALSSYIPALFPTWMRARATGFCFNIGRFFTATAVFFVGAMVSFFGGFGNALLSFSTMFIVALLSTYFYSQHSKTSHDGVYRT